MKYGTTDKCWKLVGLITLQTRKYIREQKQKRTLRPNLKRRLKLLGYLLNYRNLLKIIFEGTMEGKNHGKSDTIIYETNHDRHEL